MKKYPLIAFAFLSACATNVTPMATSGSKSDGNVVMSYEYGLFEKPMVDIATADAQAGRRCQAWGYKTAEKFDAPNKVCVSRNGYGNCMRERVNITYQCEN